MALARELRKYYAKTGDMLSVVLFIVSHGIQAGLGFTLPSFKLDNEVSVDQLDKSVENSLINSSIQTLELNLNLASVSFSVHHFVHPVDTLFIQKSEAGTLST